MGSGAASLGIGPAYHGFLDGPVPCEHQPHRRIIPFALFAPIRVVLLFLAKAIDYPVQRLGFNALFTPLHPALLEFLAGAIERFLLLIQSLAEPVEEGAVVLQLDSIHGAAGLRRVAHVL